MFLDKLLWAASLRCRLFSLTRERRRSFAGSVEYAHNWESHSLPVNRRTLRSDEAWTTTVPCGPYGRSRACELRVRMCSCAVRRVDERRCRAYVEAERPGRSRRMGPWGSGFFNGLLYMLVCGCFFRQMIKLCGGQRKTRVPMRCTIGR